ncbi:MAG: UDP-N-acetylmuramoyl-tripeptide--D-alanyl-D-alanine ligase [Deltaproteobacteria bacterium]|nr:UDP-N-acetylmuramoyl-tripeptide--D-alanyl-D-alanine ligase [Deltaproteobacteria bacterium]
MKFDGTWVMRALGVECEGGRAPSPVLGAEFTGVSTDSRRISRGDLFVALRGENFDGSAFVDAARVAGARGAVVERGRGTSTTENFVCFEVGDTLRALGDLARAWRREFDIPVVAVTGSMGKTTTKEMIAAILGAGETTSPALATAGNLNNWVGVPLTLFGLAADHRAAVLELAMSAPGEIAYLADMVRPRIGVVTNVAPVHLAGLKTIENVARAKGELYRALGGDAIAIVNADEPLLESEAKATAARVLRFSRTTATADVALVAIERSDATGSRAQVMALGSEIVVDVPIAGAHNITNALAAIAAAKALDIPDAAIVRGLAATRVPGARMRIVASRFGTIMDDTYNANPRSMVAALETLADVGRSGRRYAVLGDMLELGEGAAEFHVEVGAAAARTRVDALFAVGAHADDVVDGAYACDLRDAIAFRSLEGLIVELKARLKKSDWVLVKGSRGSRMERVVEALTSNARREEP